MRAVRASLTIILILLVVLLALNASQDILQVVVQQLVLLRRVNVLIAIQVTKDPVWVVRADAPLVRWENTKAQLAIPLVSFVHRDLMLMLLA